MFDFGIAGYQPHWLQARRDVMRAAHGRRLAALAGRPLTHVWLVWDLADDKWFPDCPVLLTFGAEQLEVNHQKFDDLSLTWNSVDPTQPVDWPDFQLAWRSEPLPQLVSLRGQTLRHVELLAWVGDDHTGKRKGMTEGGIDLGFAFTDGYLTVRNAMDENGLELAPPGSQYRRHPVLP